MKKTHILLTIFLSILLFVTGLFASIYLINYRDQAEINEKEYVSAENKLEDDLVQEIDMEEEVHEEIPRFSNIKILASGDLMFHEPQFKSVYDKEKDTYDFTPNFQHVKKYIQAAHISIGNFETVTREDKPPSGYPRFNTPKESLIAIKDAGYDILTTINNHSLDQGREGIINTIDNIRLNNMVSVGTYKTQEENKIYIKELEGIRLGFLAYSYGLNGLDPLLTKEELSYMVNLIDEEKMEEDLKNAKSLDLDLIIVSIHWGNEYQRDPAKSQIDLGEKLFDWGADIILGSHPHVIQKSQIVNKDARNKFIIYSMGNFISNQRKETAVANAYTEDGVMVVLEIEKDLQSQETIIKAADYIPTWVYRYKNENKLHYEILPIKDILEENLESGQYDHIKDRLEKSYKDTIEKMEIFP